MIGSPRDFECKNQGASRNCYLGWLLLPLVSDLPSLGISLGDIGENRKHIRSYKTFNSRITLFPTSECNSKSKSTKKTILALKYTMQHNILCQYAIGSQIWSGNLQI